MGFEYLNGKNWSEVTRDERYFCGELYFCINKDVKQFVKWLNTQTSMNLSSEELNGEWEVGFEVCFYRDYCKLNNKQIKRTNYSQKRTFDLCLFSKDRIIIIEAKSQTGFGKEQNESFGNDLKSMLEILNKNEKEFKVSLVALASSIYLNSKRRNPLPDCFENQFFSWLDIHYLFDKYKLFFHADNCYGN